MKPQVKAFQDAAAQACQQRRFPFRKFLVDYGLQDILIEADAADSSSQEIATRVLLECCVENGQFNGFQVGFLAVMLQGYLPDDLRPFRDAFVFGTVVLVLLLRPAGIIPTRALVQRV